MIGQYTKEEYYDKVLAFHGHAAPGVLIGGFLVTAAREQLLAAHPDKDNLLFEVLCESAQCLPDAVQILTPCTIGNSWMRIQDDHVYAVALYDKYTGQGCRAWLDPKKLANFPITYEWFYKLKKKHEQDGDALRKEILDHGQDMVSTRMIQMHADSFGKKQGKGAIATCPQCGEAYAAKDGECCPLCQKGRPYDFV